MGTIQEDKADFIESETGVVPEEPHSFPLNSKLDRPTLLRLDILLIPLLCGMYLLSFLDRANLGNARVAGLQQQLKLTDKQYQTAITMTYVPYIATELPSNLVLSKIGPRTMLPGMCFCWGIVTTLQSLVHSYAGLLACRFWLGFFEGGLLPGIVLYLSGYYRRHELQLRICLFFSAAALSGAFSGLLAAAITQMDGLAGLEGWRWIFLIEGLFTVVFGFCAFFLLPNKPAQVITFRNEHVKHCEDRLLLDSRTRQQESTTFDLHAFRSAFTSVHIWIITICQFAGGCILFGLAYFTPSIVASLVTTFASRPSAAEIQLLTVPPFALAFFASIASALISDRYQIRGYTAVSMITLAMVGFAVFLSAPRSNGGQKYAALCLIITGIYSAAPSLIVWIPNNVAPYTRRATAVAMSFIATNIGGIVSAWIYPRSSAPQYRFAASFNMGLVVVEIIGLLSQLFLLKHLNKRKETHREDLLRDVKDLDAQEQHQRLGDTHPDFKYTL